MRNELKFLAACGDDLPELSEALIRLAADLASGVPIPSNVVLLLWDALYEDSERLETV